MKKNLIIAAIFVTLLTSACGSGGSSSTGNSASKNGDAVSGDTSGQTSSSSDNFAQNADENVDMDAVDGEYLKVSENSIGSPKEQLGVFEVSILDAKTFEQDGNKYIVFAIDFTNNSSKEMTFASAIEALAFQDGMQVAPAALSSLPEGVDTATTMQYVQSGETITVQKVFMLTDTTTPVEIQIRPFYEETDAVASQIYDLV